MKAMKMEKIERIKLYNSSNISTTRSELIVGNNYEYCEFPIICNVKLLEIIQDVEDEIKYNLKLEIIDVRGDKTTISQGRKLNVSTRDESLGFAFTGMWKLYDYDLHKFNSNNE
jgi:hypothetical protein